jgi:glutamate--cysteine ligase
MEGGFQGLRPTLRDWDTHLTTLFPEVRLKRIIEVRGADAVPREGICALPALWKGILYDGDARAASRAMLEGSRVGDLDLAHLDVARRGLRAEMAGRKVLDLARELVSLSAAGLLRIAEAGETDRDERSFLEPLLAQIERGISPGEEIAERWRGEWGRSRERLIEATKY